MKIYDISQEVFGASVYPGDPTPDRTLLSDMRKGELYNLTMFQMCAHNGTHIDAPRHFLSDGKSVDEIALEQFIGYAYVAEFEGEIGEADAGRILSDAQKAEREKKTAPDAARRILIKGNAVLTEAGARIFAKSGLFLFGNESPSVGPVDAPMAVHLCMLHAGIVLLEGIRLSEVEEGIYFLNAAPLNLGGADGAPCRAVLLSTESE